MAKLDMPAMREFGWRLKPVETAHFAIHKRPNGQFCVVLNHALLRGVTAEMIHWWFLHFPALKVRLIDVAGYEDRQVPGYLLWHPIDHLSAELSGPLGTGGVAQAGATIHIREAMQYDRFGWTYPVDSKVQIAYIGPDGWAMGKILPLFGPVMMLRIHFRDISEAGRIIGVHYHYEVVIGTSRTHWLGRMLNRKLSARYGPEFFEAWQRHNVIEVGTFENFLPALFAQRADLGALHYSKDMDEAADPAEQRGQDRGLFETRLAGFGAAADPFAYQAFDQPSFL
ncbi:MAG: hypothetical protein AAFR17_17205 [Pseudomonadota bacterium]